ncbi:hypothetical protein FJZ31_03440 [Candidatus Poribacteria bacterium]|nr:hypothetical protein [Candidatus Poribacteria bacterium]
MKVREVLNLFEKLGMEVQEGRDTIAKFRYKGEVLVRTKVPHKRGELKGNLPYFVRQQLRLNDTQFRQFIDCTLYREDYEQILQEKGYTHE